jgi:hypothetical protein
MMGNRHGHSVNAQRTKERWHREDQATRLRDEVPSLASLRLRIEGTMDGPAYVRIIVVESAPALFEFGCTERACSGQHDLTHEVMRSLRGSQQRFQGEHGCDGQMRTASCNRILRYTAHATYHE